MAVIEVINHWSAKGEPRSQDVAAPLEHMFYSRVPRRVDRQVIAETAEIYMFVTDKLRILGALFMHLCCPIEKV